MRLTTFLLPLLGTPRASLASQQAHQPPLLQTTVTLLVAPSQQLPNPNSLPPSTRATLSALNKPYSSAPITLDNTFVFHNVTPGSYLADVSSVTHAFAPLRLDVVRDADENGEGLTVRAWETFRGNEWGNKGEDMVRVVGKGGVQGGKVVEVRCLGWKGFYLERSKFSVLSIFKNPIILLSLVSMGLFFGMPKLVENMDPEMRAEWEENQKKNPMNALMGAASGQPAANPMANFDMAAYLAGSGKKEDGNGKKKR